MIAVAHITGNQVYFQRLSDGIPYCGGAIFGIDLITGKTIYEIPQPWAVFGDICQNFKPYEKNATFADFIDYSVINSGLCVSNITEDIVSVKNFDISDIRGINETLIPFAKATFYAPVTVSNGLLYIPSATGDIFIVDVKTGDKVDLFRCNYERLGTNKNYTRRGIRAGVTVIEDRVIFYCGDSLSLGSELSFIGETDTVLHVYSLKTESPTIEPTIEPTISDVIQPTMSPSIATKDTNLGLIYGLTFGILLPLIIIGIIFILWYWVFDDKTKQKFMCCVNTNENNTESVALTEVDGMPGTTVN